MPDLTTYTADGLEMHSHFFAPSGGGKHPGVLVFPEAFGLGEHAMKRAERLAGLGYAALACDLHGQGYNAAGLDEAIGLLGPLYADPAKTRARAQGGLTALLARPEVDAGKIAAIGYCFGGTMSLELGRGGADLRAIVGFHSGLGTKAPATRMSAKVLACIGADDPMIDNAQRQAFEQEMRAAGVDYQLHVYGGVVHSFTNEGAAAVGKPDAIRYSALADSRSWASMLALFGEAFG